MECGQGTWNIISPESTWGQRESMKMFESRTAQARGEQRRLSQQVRGEGHCGRGDSTCTRAGWEKHLLGNKLTDHSTLPTLIFRPLFLGWQRKYYLGVCLKCRFQTPQTSWIRTSILAKAWWLTCTPHSERQTSWVRDRPPAGTEVLGVGEGEEVAGNLSRAAVDLQDVFKFGLKVCLWGPTQLSLCLECWGFSI